MFATVARVQALGDQLNGKILMSHNGSSTANTLAVIKAAQDAGAVGVVMCQNVSGDQNIYYVPNIGTTGDALNITIPVGGTIRMMCREFDEYVRNGGENKLTIGSTPAVRTSTTAGPGSIYYHWERLVGAFLFNIEAAHTYASRINGQVVDANGNLIPKATLDLSLDVKSRLWQSGDNATHTMPRPESPYVNTQTSHLDVAGGEFSWAVTPSSQPHFTNDGYVVTAKANGKYDNVKNVVVANRKEIIDDVDFTLPDAINVEFDFDKAYSSNNNIKIPFTTYVLDAASNTSVKGNVDDVTATINGIPVDVVSLGNGNYAAAFNPGKVLGGGIDEIDLVIDFDGPAHSAFTSTIILTAPPTVYASVGALEKAHFTNTVEYSLKLREAENVLAVDFEFIVDSAMLIGSSFETVNGFGAVESIKWTDNGDGTWTGAVRFGYTPPEGENGFNSVPYADVAKIVFNTTGLLGEANLTITKLEVTGFDEAAEAGKGDVVFYNVIIEVGKGTTILYNKYDLNKDGVVDLIDLGIMLLYVGYNSGDPEWDVLVKVNDKLGNGITAKDCDVNDDDEIDMADLIELLANFGI